jgi:hypothetical protein
MLSSGDCISGISNGVTLPFAFSIASLGIYSKRFYTSYDA